MIMLIVLPNTGKIGQDQIKFTSDLDKEIDMATCTESWQIGGR
jgi:hypothetical protein